MTVGVMRLRWSMMKIGDLVKLAVVDSPDSGIIIECVDYRRGNIFEVLWMDGALERIHEDDLRLINENR